MSSTGVATTYFPPMTELANSVGKDSFLFSHSLSGHELFTRDAVKRLVETIGALHVRQSFGGIPPGFFIKKDVGHLEWGSPEFQRALDEAYDNIDFSGSRIKLSDIQQVDVYRDLLAACILNLSEVTGIDFQRDFSRAIATLFISSPGEQTPYHVDQEVNFLLQIDGIKHVSLFDGNDRAVVTSEHMEEFWMGNSFIERSHNKEPKSYVMGPYQGVHQPPFFPHLITVGDSMSVSLSLGFRKAKFPEAEVYRMNSYLRKLGLTPNPPGSSQVVDGLKSAIIRPALRAKERFLGSNGATLSSLKKPAMR
ncbi:MAG: hypothetical protein PW789_11555 [Edaphobacter sp.]|uniref:hypothetical protein n=1 Tax=Edaphobacter sp. TaxID=1934404 RepID=UPI00238A6159|nr:hypothetical protein [Edaphobacter sp.]MDE1177221.1 hypothetical protein [Edaphobacter sp.]